MDAKERFDACMQLANHGAGRHDERRDYEWKVALGLWALIGAATIYRDKWSTQLPVWLIAALCAIVLGGYGRLWLYRLWKANAFNQKDDVHFRAQAIEILKNPSHTPTDFNFATEDVSFLRFLKDWSMRFQLFATALLLILLLLLILRR